MATTYHPYKIALTDGQKKKLQKAYVSKTAVALRVKPEQIGRGDELLLTATQISRVKKTAPAGKGLELKLSQTQIQNTAQSGGNLTPAQKKEVERYLVGQGVGRRGGRGGAAQYGGFLGMLASIGVPLTIDLVKKILGKGLQREAPHNTAVSLVC